MARQPRTRNSPDGADSHIKSTVPIRCSQKKPAPVPPPLEKKRHDYGLVEERMCSYVFEAPNWNARPVTLWAGETIRKIGPREHWQWAALAAETATCWHSSPQEWLRSARHTFP